MQDWSTHKTDSWRKPMPPAADSLSPHSQFTWLCFLHLLLSLTITWTVKGGWIRPGSGAGLVTTHVKYWSLLGSAFPARSCTNYRAVPLPWGGHLRPKHPMGFSGSCASNVASPDGELQWIELQVIYYIQYSILARLVAQPFKELLRACSGDNTVSAPC